MDISVYVAGLYSESPLLKVSDIFNWHNHNHCLLMDFIFLRGVGKSRVISAWAQQLDYSVSHRYEGYEGDRDLFIEMFSSPIAYKGTQTVKLVGEDTILVNQGKEKGSIRGREFQKAFLSMWFGEQAVAEDLKTGLLSGATHFKDPTSISAAAALA